MSLLDLAGSVLLGVLVASLLVSTALALTVLGHALDERRRRIRAQRNAQTPPPDEGQNP